MLLFMSDTTEPALFDLLVDLRGLHLRVDRNDPGAEFLIVMRPRRPMTPVTVSPLSGGMMKSVDPPFFDAVTIPAVLSKQRLMGIKMTDVTAQIRMQEGVIHPGNLFDRDMFPVAKKAVPFRPMETDLGPQGRLIVKFMTVQAHIIAHLPPRSVAVAEGR